MHDYYYPGSELSLFAGARNWKSYLRTRMATYISGDVLEVGAGIGTNTAAFRDVKVDHWVCLEPDQQLAAALVEALGDSVESRSLRVEDLGENECFDTVLYIDVLEHIPDDGGELTRAAGHLRQNGFLVVLSPAHSWLFSEFDAAVGHCRRYTKGSLQALTPRGLRVEELIYLDSAGMLASLGNRLLLRRSVPSEAQIQLWDKYMVRISRVLDRLLGYSIGKSVLAVWRKTDPAATATE